MTVIQGGRWEAWARRLFSLKGSQEPQSVSPEMILTANIIPARGEDAILRGDKLYHGFGISTAAAANNGYVGLYNESARSLVTVEQAIAFNPFNPCEFSLRLANVVIGTGPSTIGGRDTRLGVNLVGKSQSGTIYVGHTAVTGTQVQRLAAPVYTNCYFMCPIVLAPGDGFLIFNMTQNEVIRASFAWHEREAEPGELTV